MKTKKDNNKFTIDSLEYPPFMLNPAEMTIVSVIEEAIGRYLNFEERMRVVNNTFFPCTVQKNGDIEFDIDDKEGKLSPEDEAIIEETLSKMKIKDQTDILDFNLVYERFKKEMI